MNQYCPIGTIVRLSIDKSALFMIAGYMITQGDGRCYDYFAVPFPLGLVKDNQYISFNRNCIVEVVHNGYCDEECQTVLNGLDRFVENMKSFSPNEDSNKFLRNGR